jgi:hypothetical protein
MVAPSQTPPLPPRPAANSTPAVPVYLPPDQFSGWISLLGISLLVMGLLAGIVLFSPPHSVLSTLWSLGGTSARGESSRAPAPSGPTAPTPAARGPAGTMLAPAVPCTAQDTGAFRQSVTIGIDQHVCGNVVVVGGDMTIFGTVDGNVTLVSGTGVISGTINGNITAVDANLTLRKGADIGGSVQVVGGSIQRDNGVSVGGSIDRGIDPQHILPPFWQGAGSPYNFPWSHLLFWVLASIAVTALFPRHVALVRRAARGSLVPAFFVGVLCAILGAIVVVGFVFTCVGIPLALLIAVSLVVASVVGTIALGLWLGERLLGRSANSRRASVFPAMVGVTLLALAQTAPCVGDVVTVLTSCTGLGASILALLYARRRAAWTPQGML